jgi:hypothetical protein
LPYLKQFCRVDTRELHSWSLREPDVILSHYHGSYKLGVRFGKRNNLDTWVVAVVLIVDCFLILFPFFIIRLQILMVLICSNDRTVGVEQQMWLSASLVLA